MTTTRAWTNDREVETFAADPADQGLDVADAATVPLCDVGCDGDVTGTTQIRSDESPGSMKSYELVPSQRYGANYSR